MNDEVFKCYAQISIKRSELNEAFEHYEMNKNAADANEASKKYRELLSFWRSYLKPSASTNKSPNSDVTEEDLKHNLERIEKEYACAYSPNELSHDKIRGFLDQLKGYLATLNDNKIIEYKVTFLLSRLLYNTCLLQDCYFPIHEKPYEDFLTNIKNFLNKCIIISQLDYFSEYFEEIVSDFNDDFESVTEVTPHILNIVGVLNFKCHQYKEAISLFDRAVQGYERANQNQHELYKNGEYFQTKLLLAYCYEYNHDFEKAISELIGLDVDSLLKLCDKLIMYDLLDEKSFSNSRHLSQEIINKIKDEAVRVNRKRNLLTLATSRDKDLAAQKESLVSDSIGDLHEVLHSLGHCLNELGIKEKMELSFKDVMTRDNKQVVKLLCVSRLIMLEVAEQNSDCEDFQTCLYMLYGEAKDYDICLKRIDVLYRRIEESIKKNINLRMENIFYRFLVLNQSNKVIHYDNSREEADKSYDEFKKFAVRKYDYDALIHIEIVRFRSRIINILLTEVDDKRVFDKLSILRDTPEGKNMFDIKPSAKLNQWIVQEYNKTIALYEFLVKYFDSKNTSINTLYNLACRFIFFRNMFEKEKEQSFVDNKDKIGAIQRTIELIMDDVVSPQSIFLLAPLTSAVPYQHQTQSLLKLESELFLKSDNMPPNIDKLGNFQRLHEALMLSRKATDLKKWLFSHSEYAPIFMITKKTPDQNCDRYYYADKNGVVLERPIHNIARINYLFGVIGNQRPTKRHSTCANGQSKCCICIVEGEYKEKIEPSIKEICAELLVPTEAYEGKHFVVDYRVYKTHPTIEWSILGFEKSLSKIHGSEVVQYLCGTQENGEYKIAISKQDYCFVAFRNEDSRIATSDMFYMQEKGISLWYSQSHEDDYNFEKWLKDAKAALFFLSYKTDFSASDNNNFVRQIEKISKTDHLREKTIFIVNGFETDGKLSESLGKYLDDNMVDFIRLHTVFRHNDDCDDYEHMGKVIQDLQRYGVKRNELQ